MYLLFQKDKTALQSENRGLKYKYDLMKKQASEFKKERNEARSHMASQESTISLLQQQVQILSSAGSGYVHRQPAPVIYGMPSMPAQPKMSTSTKERDSVESVEIPEYIK